MNAHEVLIAALAVNASLGFGYRVYRLARGGPIADVWGQAVLAVFLGALAVLIGMGWDPARWPALVYAVLFGVVVMPIWVLAVLIPQRPGAPDYAYTIIYWVSLFVIAGSAIAY